MTRQPRSVLIVDDEELLRSILSTIITREGFSVLEAANGLEALTIMQQNPVELVITDVIMPEMDGMELLVQIKKDYPRTRVAVITGHPGNSTPEEAIANGADHYILKPFQSDQICSALRDMAKTI